MMKPYKILISEEKLHARIGELGRSISDAYGDQPLIVVSMLKGSLYFLADLTRAITIDTAYDMVAVSSEQARMQLTRDITLEIKDKHVLVVEEIVRTGLTTNFLIQHLETKKPKSLAVCALLANPKEQLIELPLKEIGFIVDTTRVIGYGMDYREHDRTLPFIAELEKDRYT